MLFCFDPLRRGFIALLLLCLSLPYTSGQTLSMEFQDKSIADILLALGEFADKSIIPDETVAGRASYYFADMEFERALEVFLKTYKLFYEFENGIYYVSRIRAGADVTRGKISIDAEDVDIRHILNAISRALDKTVLYDALPPESVTLHVREMAPESLLTLLSRKLRDFELEVNPDYYYLKKTEPATATPAQRRQQMNWITVTAGLYSIFQTKRPFFELVDELFQKAGREYSLITQRNILIEQLRFVNKPFDTMLGLILEQAGADYRVLNGIYYVFEISQRSVLNRLKSTVTVPLVYITPEELQKLFPADVAGRIVKVDSPHRAVVLTGSPQEIGPVREFIKMVDRPVEGSRYYRFDLSFLEAEGVQDLLPAGFKTAEFLNIPESNSFAMLLSAEGKAQLERYLTLIDREKEITALKLKYIKAEDLLEHLPPSVAKGDIVATGDPSVIFFRGSRGKQEAFRRELAVLDQPVPQITYQLLVVQFAEGNSLKWQEQVNSLATLTYPKNIRNAFTGNFGHLLDLNFDVFTALGTKIALELNLALSENKAAAERIAELTGVTREVSTGLIVSIQGWASGDGMITMEVDATVSKQGVDTASTAGSLPPTTEKMVSTQVRTLSGSPVILSGLYRWDAETVVDKTPVLGDIPLLGLLFRKSRETKTKSEVVIYIMPHVEVLDGDRPNEERRWQNLYHNLFRPAFEG